MSPSRKATFVTTRRANNPVPRKAVLSDAVSCGDASSVIDSKWIHAPVPFEAEGIQQGKSEMEGRAMKHRDVESAMATLPRSYRALFAAFPLRPITSDSLYDRAARMIHSLAIREGSLDAGEEAYLEILEMLVERYDRQRHPMDADDVSPTQVLRVLVEQAGMNVTELGQLLGSKGAASELLSGKRKEPSKAQIARLCDRFKVDAALFLLAVKKSANAA